MKYSESWLREWVDPNITRDELCNTLTMSGLEVEEAVPAADEFTNVVVGEVLQLTKHPDAERLNVCEVTTGKDKLQIVCGAANVKQGMKVAVAMIGAKLPNNLTITQTKLRGVESHGMLCSAKELGLSDDHEGLLELSSSAPLGEDIRNHLKLDDYIIDVSITPNRGDCLSVRGMAREISAVTKTSLKPIHLVQVTPENTDVLSIVVNAKEACPQYAGRVIRGVKADAETPVWLKERLRKSGIRSISPVVDVTNYVMLELGQPMHAFDLAKIKQGIVVRQAKKGETIALLDGSTKELNAETVVIADHEQALAIAGVMGGIDSSVTLLTTDIFLESAFFKPDVVAKQRQYYNLSSESAYRFERGVDPTIQQEAIERATQLILEIAGGKAGPVIDVVGKNELPALLKITLNKDKITKVLGVDIPDADITAIFNRLNFKYETENKNSWVVTVPAYRFDITLPEDLIEEIARLYGYDNIPTHTITAPLQVQQIVEEDDYANTLRLSLADLGYHEIVSYSFIDKKRQQLFDPDQTPFELVNPITADMSVMRTNLWAGLVNTLLYNKSRQQHRVRLFELGAAFINEGENISQQVRLAGLVTGLAQQEQWGIPAREVDFFDLKGDVENLLLQAGLEQAVFKPDAHPALHPGQTAGIFYENQKIGMIGALHPLVLKALDINDRVFVFELNLALFKSRTLPRSQEISKFPENRRDIAILVSQTIPAEDIQATIERSAGAWLKDSFIFDVYQGKGIAPGLKSVALGLIIQHPSRTLVDAEITDLVDNVISALKEKLGAQLRS